MGKLFRNTIYDFAASTLAVSLLNSGTSNYSESGGLLDASRTITHKKNFLYIITTHTTKRLEFLSELA